MRTTLTPSFERTHCIVRFVCFRATNVLEARANQKRTICACLTQFVLMWMFARKRFTRQFMQRLLSGRFFDRERTLSQAAAFCSALWVHNDSYRRLFAEVRLLYQRCVSVCISITRINYWHVISLFAPLLELVRLLTFYQLFPTTHRDSVGVVFTIATAGTRAVTTPTLERDLFSSFGNRR